MSDVQAFVQFGCFTKTFHKGFVSGTKRVPLLETWKRPCISQSCRRNLRNVFIVARQYRFPYSKPTHSRSLYDNRKEKRATFLGKVFASVSSMLARCFVSTLVYLLAMSFSDRLEASAARGKTFESTTTALLESSESFSRTRPESPITLVKGTGVSEQSQTKQSTKGRATSPKVQLEKSEKFVTWGLTLLVFAGVCFVLYKISLKEEEEEAKAIEREYQRLEQLKREFIEADDDSPVRDEELLSSLRKRLENQTVEDREGSSEEDDEAKEDTSAKEESNIGTEPTLSEQVISSEKGEGVSSEHLDMLRRMYEGTTSMKNTEDGNTSCDGNEEEGGGGDGRNTSSDTKYDEKGSKGRKNRA